MKKIFLLTLACAAVLSAEAADKKRVIVCTVTEGFRHDSIPLAEKTIAKLGEESGAYEVVDFAQQPNVNIPKEPSKPQEPGKPKELKPDADEKAKAKFAEDTKKYEAAMVKHGEAMKKYEDELAKWTPEKKAEKAAAEKKRADQLVASMTKISPKYLIENKIDAVIFANTTGELPLIDKEGFIKWIEDGHAFCAMHSGTDTLAGFPGYYNMLQGTFLTHQNQVAANLIAADPAHPANAGIGPKWDLKMEEMYLIKNHDPAKVHAIWYLNHHPNDPKKTGYYPVSWCRMAGTGRVFYTSLGHRQDLWSDDPALKGRENPVEISKQYQQHILGGIKWALGLEKGEAAPNPDVVK